MTFRASVVACLMLCGCQSAAVEPAPVAGAFVQALNARNVGGMAALAATPFRYRNQPWQSAPDGSGFVLGTVEDRVAGSPDQLRALLQDVSSVVQVEDSVPVANAPSKRDLLGDTLKGAPSQWNDMNLVLFRRGESDVEHVAIVGVDAKGRVTGLYVN